MSMLNALSFDIEDYFQVEGFAGVISREEWANYEPRVVANTGKILDILKRTDTTATFFILGWIAERFPELISDIAGDGHEVATHGYWHRPLTQQTAEEFSNDIASSISAIQHAAPAADIRGYRAPTFSITRDTLWAFDVLKKHGLTYDSSIFPLAAHDRYGISDAPRFAHGRDHGIWEFPISTLRFSGNNMPIGGGGYFRLLPLWMTHLGIKRINGEGHPAVFYLHPWELDPGQPVVHDATTPNKFRHYVNLKRTEKKLEALLRRHRFGPMCEVFADHLEVMKCA
jgi:polysaccharide deacetylase family protein (PEP-CTERM system associated)